MPVIALSQSVVRALGSSQVLTTPVSLVKELVENALDAHASSIVVEISSNTLDCVQVKDNGHGIAPDDRDDVAKRHFTSKIRDMAELKELGGRYLGFRGEALASAAELAGSLELVTRIEGEKAACKMFIGRTGQVNRHESVSHPIGTTARVTKFLQNIPVRKEVALKNALRTLNEVKQLLQKYALARPAVRLSLKVLKAKNDKYNWIYAPGKNATVAEAALSIFETVEPHNEVDMSSSNDNPFRFEAFLPKPNAEPSLISNKGHFISVDSRPVSCTKGALKQALTLYKDYIRSALSNATSTRIKDPLICMNIICPPASYDPNVEAAKDDVLFANQTLLLDSVGAFFSRIYGPLKKEDPQLNAGKTKAAQKTNAFELLLARRRPETDVSKYSRQAADSRSNVIGLPSEQDTAHQLSVKGGTISEGSLDSLSVAKSIPSPGYEQASDDRLFFEAGRSPGHQPGWRSTMYDLDDDCFDEPAREITIEKNARSQRTNHATEKLQRASETKMQSTGLQMNSTPQSSISISNLTILPTPSSDSQTFPSCSLSSPGRQAEQLGISPHARPQSITFPPTPSSSDYFPRVNPRVNLLSLERPFDQAKRNTSENQSSGYQGPNLTPGSEHTLPSDATASSRRTSQGNRAVPAHAEMSRSRHIDGFVTARSLPRNGAFDLEPAVQRPDQTEQSSRRRKEHVQFELMASAKDINRTLFDVGGRVKTNVQRKGQNMDIREALASTSSNRSGTRSSGPNEPSGILKSSSSTTSVHPDLEELLDYERRKKIATDRRREMLLRKGDIAGFLTRQHGKHGQQLTTPNSPHRNRYHAAIAALHDPAQNDVGSTSTLPLGDPRAYFLRMASNNNRGAQESMRRPKISMLPLEAVPESFRLQNVRLSVQTTVAWVEERLQQVRLPEHQASDGDPSSNIFTTDESTPELQKRLTAIVNTHYRQDSGEMPNLILDLQTLFRDNHIPFS